MKGLAMLMAVGLLAAAASAQTTPGPEVKKLDVFVGSWTLDADYKTQSGAGGKITESEKCEWMEGNFFLVCHTDFKSGMGNGSGISVMGYSTDDKTYTYRAFNSWGEFEDSKGALDGDTWTFTSNEKFGTGRFTMKITSATSYNVTFDMSKDGTNWMTVMEGKASKSK